MTLQSISDLSELTLYAENPRRAPSAEELGMLAESIKLQGVLLPLITRQDPRDPTKKQVIAGARRLKAVDLLENLGELPPRFKLDIRHLGVISDQEAFEISVTENVHREDMSEHDKVQAIALVATTRGLQSAADKLSLKLQEVERAVEISKADPGVQEALKEGQINLAQAHALALVARDNQLDFLEKTLQLSWTSRDIREACKKDLIPVSRARFDPRLYQGEPRKHLFDEEAYFTDKQQFVRLQYQALEKEKNNREGYLFVSIGTIPEGFERVLDVKNADPSRCGLVLSVNHDTGEVKEQLVQKCSLAAPPPTRKEAPVQKGNMKSRILGGQQQVKMLQDHLKSHPRLLLVALLCQLLEEGPVKIIDHPSGMYGLHPLVRTEREAFLRRMVESGVPLEPCGKDLMIRVPRATDSTRVLFAALLGLPEGDLQELFHQVILSLMQQPHTPLFKLLAHELGLTSAWDGHWEAYLGTLDREELVQFVRQHGLGVQVHPGQKKKDIVKMLLECPLELSRITPPEFLF